MCTITLYIMYIWVTLKAIFVYERGGQSDAAMKGLVLRVKIDHFKGKCFPLSTFYT